MNGDLSHPIELAGLLHKFELVSVKSSILGLDYNLDLDVEIDQCLDLGVGELGFMVDGYRFLETFRCRSKSQKESLGGTEDVPGYEHYLVN